MDLWEELLGSEEPVEGPLVAGAEVVVAGQGLFAGLLALDHVAQFHSQGGPEVEGGADPLRGQRVAVSG